jgi:hypothetical protein
MRRQPTPAECCRLYGPALRLDVGRSFANSRVALGVRACLCAVTVNAASTMQMLGPATSDPNVRKNGIGIRTYLFLDAPFRAGPVTTAAPPVSGPIKTARDKYSLMRKIAGPLPRQSYLLSQFYTVKVFKLPPLWARTAAHSGSLATGSQNRHSHLTWRLLGLPKRAKHC